MTETYENLCNPKTFTHIIDMLAYCEREGNVRGIQVFESMRKEAIQKCGIIIRNLDAKLYNGQKEKKYTLIDFQKFELNEDGSLNVVVSE